MLDLFETEPLQYTHAVAIVTDYKMATVTDNAMPIVQGITVAIVESPMIAWAIDGVIMKSSPIKELRKIYTYTSEYPDYDGQQHKHPHLL